VFHLSIYDLIRININETIHNFADWIYCKVIASFASTSPNQSFRFIAFQLLSRVIAICTDDAKVVLLNELLTACPFETMRCAAIGLVKENVAKSLERISQVKAGEKVKQRKISFLHSDQLILGYSAFPI
jgi:hypothetical protein